MLDAVVRLLDGDGEATAFAVHPDGWFLTCDHSLADRGDAQVMLSHNRQEIYDAEIVLRRPDLDVAVLRVREGGPFVSLTIGDAAEVGRQAHLFAHFTLDRVARMSAWAPTGFRHVEVWWVLPSLVDVLACPTDDEGRGLLVYHAPDHVETGCSGAPITAVHGSTVFGMHTSELYRGIGSAVRGDVLKTVLKEAGMDCRAWTGRAGKRTKPEVLSRARERYTSEWLNVTFTTNVDLDEMTPEDAQRRLDYLAETGQNRLNFPSMDTLLGYLYFGVGDVDRAYEFGCKAFDETGNLRTARLLKAIAMRGQRTEEIVSALRSVVEASPGQESYASSVRRCSLAIELLGLLWKLERHQDMIDVCEVVRPYIEQGDREMRVRCLRSRALTELGRSEEALGDYEKMWAERADGVEALDFVGFAKALAATPGQEIRAVRLGMWAMSWPQAPRGLFVQAAQAAGGLGFAHLQGMLTERATIAHEDDIDLASRVL